MLVGAVRPIHSLHSCPISQRVGRRGFSWACDAGVCAPPAVTDAPLEARVTLNADAIGAAAAAVPPPPTCTGEAGARGRWLALPPGAAEPPPAAAGGTRQSWYWTVCMKRGMGALSR